MMLTPMVGLAVDFLCLGIVGLRCLVFLIRILPTLGLVIGFGVRTSLVTLVGLLLIASSCRLLLLDFLGELLVGLFLPSQGEQ